MLNGCACVMFRYKIWNMKVKGFGAKPELKVTVKKSVRIEVRNIDLQFEHFDFFLDRFKFPKVKDTGVGQVSCKCWCFLAFEIKLDEDKNMAVDKFRAQVCLSSSHALLMSRLNVCNTVEFVFGCLSQVTIDDLPMDIVKCNHKKIFKTLLKMFQKKGKEGVQDEIRKKTQENIKMLSDKVTELFAKFGGKSKLAELKEEHLNGEDSDGGESVDSDNDEDGGSDSDYSDSETGSDLEELEDGCA